MPVGLEPVLIFVDIQVNQFSFQAFSAYLSTNGFLVEQNCVRVDQIVCIIVNQVHYTTPTSDEIVNIQVCQEGYVLCYVDSSILVSVSLFTLLQPFNSEFVLKNDHFLRAFDHCHGQVKHLYSVVICFPELKVVKFKV